MSVHNHISLIYPALAQEGGWREISWCHFGSTFCVYITTLPIYYLLVWAFLFAVNLYVYFEGWPQEKSVSPHPNYMRFMHLIFFWCSLPLSPYLSHSSTQLLPLWDPRCQVHCVTLTFVPAVSGSWGQGVGEGHPNWKMCSLARHWEERSRTHWPCVTPLPYNRI